MLTNLSKFFTQNYMHPFGTKNVVMVKKKKNKIKVVFVELCSLVIAYNIPTWEVYFPLNAHISIQTSKHEGQTETILLFKLCKKVR